MNEKDKNKINSDRGTKRKSPGSEEETNEENESKESSPLNGILIEDDDESARSKLQKFNDCIDISTVFKKDFGSRKFNTKPRPNYFYCVRINNKEIIKSIDDCQKEIIKRNEHIAKAAIKIETLHITLMAIHIKNRDQIEPLNQLIIESINDMKSTTTMTNLELRLKGLSTFRNQVVYVDLEKNESYESLVKFQKDLVKSIEKWDRIHLCEKSFTPHLTLMKLSKFKGSHKKGIKKINKDAYEHFIESHFGVEIVDEIHLCNMHEKQSDGFYKIEATHKFCG